MEEKIAERGRIRVSDDTTPISVLCQCASREKGSPRTENDRTEVGGKGEEFRMTPSFLV